MKVNLKIIACVATLWITGCASPAHVQEQALSAFDEGRAEDGLIALQSELVRRPHDAELRMAWLTLRERAINDWLSRAADPAAQSASDRTVWYRRVLSVAPGNERALAGLDQIDRQARVAKLLLDAQLTIDTKNFTDAKSKVKAALDEEPLNRQGRVMLQSLVDTTAAQTVSPAMIDAFQKTLSIEFKDATLKQAFEVIAKTSGINFVLDKDIKADQRMSLSLDSVSVKDAVDLLLLTNQLEQRNSGRNTILIYPNTPAKQKDYQALNVRTFFLANADCEQVANTLKTILKMRDVVVDKVQSAVIARDTPSALQMAEKIVAVADLPTPETMIEVEVLEVNRDRLESLGIQYPSSLTLTPLPASGAAALTLADLRHMRPGALGASNLPAVINASGTDSDLRTLANPRIRVRNRETAKILIGDRVPNITSTSTSTGFVSENIQYLDVGLKVEFTPTISIDNEVAIKVSLEVSSIAKQITTSAGTTAYQIGTRTASTVLRLKDGENQILAGLIDRQDSRTMNKIPGLGDFPLLGHLFGSETSDRGGSEIVLSITPRLIRNTPRPAASLLEFESGTESSLHGPDIALPIAGSIPMSGGSNRVPPPKAGLVTGGSGGTSSVGSTANAAAATASNAAPMVMPAAESSPVAIPPVGAIITPWSWSGPASATVGIGFQQQLVLNEVQPASAVALTFGYDPVVLQITSLTEGSLLNSDGNRTTVVQHIDAATGQARLTVSRAAGSAVGSAGSAPVAVVSVIPLAQTAETTVRVLAAVVTSQDGQLVNLPLPPPQSISITAKGAAP